MTPVGGKSTQLSDFQSLLVTKVSTGMHIALMVFERSVRTRQEIKPSQNMARWFQKGLTFQQMEEGGRNEKQPYQLFIVFNDRVFAYGVVFQNVIQYKYYREVV